MLPPNAVSRWTIGLLTGLLYACLLAGLFLPQTLGQQTLFAGDISQHYLPWEHFASREITTGHLPVLHHGFYLGHPLLAEGQAAVFYPVTRFWYAVLGQGILAGDIHAFNLDVLCHWLIAGWGCWYLATLLGLPWRSAFIAGLCACLAGHLLVLPINVPLLRVVAWTGWLLAAITLMLRHGALKHLWLLTGIIVLMLLAGGPQMTAMVAVGAVVYLLASLGDVRENMKPILAIGGLFLAPILAGLLSAFQLFPTWLLYQESAVKQFAGAEALAFSATWLSLSTWLLPTTWLTRLPGEHPLPTYFPIALWIGTCGALTSIVSLFVRETPLRLKVLLFVLLLCALGSMTPVYPFLLQLIPPLGMFRAPDRYLAIAVFPLCVLAGFGLEALLQSEDADEPIRSRLSTILAVLLFGGTLLLAVGLGQYAVQVGSADTSLPDRWWQATTALAPEVGMQLGIGGALLLLIWPSLIRRIPPAVTVTGVAVFTCAQVMLLRPAIPPLRTVPTERLSTPPPVAQALLDHQRENADEWGRLVVVQPVQQAAALFPDQSALMPGTDQTTTDFLAWHHGAGDIEAQMRKFGQLHPNTGTLWGLEYVGGIASLYTARMNEYLTQMEGAQLPALLQQGHRPAGTTMLDLAAGRYLLMAHAPPRSLFPSTEVDGQVIAINAKAKSLCYLMQPHGLMPETPENLYAIVELRRSPGQFLVIDGITTEEALPPPDPVIPTVGWVWIDNQTLVASVEPLGPSWLVVNLQWLPGWSVKVNEKYVPHHRAWGTMIALPLDAGPKVIELRYRPPGYLPGLQVSFVTLLAFMAASVWWSPLGVRMRAKLAGENGVSAIEIYDD